MSKELTEKEMRLLISLAGRVLWSSSETRRRLQEHKINITPANFYSTVPLVSDIENSFEYKPPQSEFYNGGLFSPPRIQAFVDEISVYAEEFPPPRQGNNNDPTEFFWKNPAFSHSDAMSYYCVLRHFKPERVLENPKIEVTTYRRGGPRVYPGEFTGP